MTDLPPNSQAGGGGLVPAVATIESPRAERRGLAGEPGVLTGAALLLGGVGLAMANFMAVLDTTIANVSVPNIAGGLAVSPDEGTWVITSYGVAEAITVPLTGWLAARFGTVRVFSVAIVLFALFSALCGLAPSLGALVFFRICQGLCGGPMIPLSQTLLLRIFPKEKAGQAISLWSMTTLVAPVIGPLLGGYLCDNYGWEWVFYVNIPIAGLCFFLITRTFAGRETPLRRMPVDFVGMGLLVVWVGSLQIMLDKGKELDWFASPFIVVLLVVAIVGFAAFMIWELTAKNPAVSLKVFRHRSFATSCAIMCAAYSCFFGSSVLIPLWLQTNLGYTATDAGHVTAFNGVLAIIFSPIVGRLVGKVDPRRLVFGGLIFLACVFWWRTTFATNIDYVHLVVPQIVMGLGIPFFFIPLMTLGTASLPPDEIASGASLFSFCRTTTGAFAVSLITTAWTDTGVRDRVQLLNHMGGDDATLASLRAAGLSPAQALSQLEGIVQQQAVMLATNSIFQIMTAMLVLAACLVWIAPKPRGKLSAPAGH